MTQRGERRRGSCWFHEVRSIGLVTAKKINSKTDAAVM